VYNEARALERKATEEAAAKVKERQNILIRAAEIERNLQLQMVQARLKTEADARAKANAEEKKSSVDRMMEQKRARDENDELTRRLDRAQADARSRMEEEEGKRFANRLRQEGQLQRDNARQAVQGLRDRVDGWRNVRTVIGEAGKADEEASRKSSRRAATQSRTTSQRSGLGRLLNLEPYEVTNLGYQAVDVVQGGLSGVSPAIIAAQQGPQIVQIFGTSILKWTPIIVAGLGSIAVAVGALQRTFREQESTREFQSLLTDNANAIKYSVAQLNDLRKAARDMGMSWTEAGAAIKTGIDNNIAQDRLKTLLQMAQDVKITTGGAVPEAMKEFTAAVSGGGEELLRLNDTYHVLSREELLHARRQIEAGQTEDARRTIIERLSKALRDRADVMEGPWSKATRALSKAWDDLLVTISKTEGFQTANNWLLTIIGSTGDLIKKIDELSTKGGLGKTLLGALVGPNSVVARALEEIRSTLGQKPLDWSGTQFATEAGARPGGTLSTNMVGNQKIVADWLSSHGYDATHAAAVMGNLQIESSFNPAAVGPLGHVGIAQWDENRRTKLGVTTSTPLVQQLEAFDKELAEVIPDFKTSTGNLRDITGRLRDRFERPYAGAQLSTPQAVADLNARTRAAEKFYLPPSSATTSATAADAARGAPVSTGPTDAQTREGQKQTEQAEKQLAIDRARNIEAERQARYAQVTAEINTRDIDDQSKGRLIAIEKEKIDLDLFRARTELEQKREKEKIDYARHYNEIVEAGNTAVAEALKTQNIGWREQERIRDQAQAKEADRLGKIDQQNKAFDAAVKAVDDLERSLNGAFGPNMELRLAGVRTRFADMVKGLKELREAATLTEKGPIDELIKKVEKAEPRAEFLEQGKVLEEQAKAAVAARNDLVEANRALREAGAISISEEQEKNKQAFDLTKTAIDDATASLDKWIVKAKEMGVPTIQIEKTKAEVQKLKVESNYNDPFWKGLVKTAEESFATRGAEAFDTIAQAIGGAIAKTKEWKDVWVSMKSAAANFFAGILKDLASYIIKAELAELASSFIPALKSFPGVGAAATTAATSGATATAAGTASQLGATAALVMHGGGVAGISQLPVSLAYRHRGSTARRATTTAHRWLGLAANEQAAILQARRGGTSRQDNPRHI
jgi:hypothetical protein